MPFSISFLRNCRLFILAAINWVISFVNDLDALIILLYNYLQFHFVYNNFLLVLNWIMLFPATIDFLFRNCRLLILSCTCIFIKNDVWIMLWNTVAGYIEGIVCIPFAVWSCVHLLKIKSDCRCILSVLPWLISWVNLFLSRIWVKFTVSE